MRNAKDDKTNYQILMKLWLGIEKNATHFHSVESYPHNGEANVISLPSEEELSSLQREVEMARESVKSVTQQLDESKTNLDKFVVLFIIIYI